MTKLKLIGSLVDTIKEQGRYSGFYVAGPKEKQPIGYDYEDKKVLTVSDVASLSTDDLLSEKIVTDAESSLGTQYCYGGNDPQSGIDCSGFVFYYYNKNGLTIPRTARDQYKKAKKLTKEELRIGDLIFFENTQNSIPAGEASHVGFVHKIHPDGKIDMLHSGSSSGVSIIEDVLNDGYHKNHFLGFGRLI